MKLKLLTFLILFNIVTLRSYGVGQWRMHPSFADEVSHVIETPEYVYLSVATTGHSDYMDDAYCLFRYDKKGEEMQALSPDNLLSFHTIQDIQYNPEKKYLAVVYTNSDIDLLYDNGKVVNVPTYKFANVNTSKKVNSIAIDPSNDKFYLATDFGYVAINDKKGEIAESRNYGTKLNSVANVADKIVIIKGDDILMAPISEPRMSLQDYEVINNIPFASAIYPLSASRALIKADKGYKQQLYFLTIRNGEPSFEYLGDSQFLNMENNSAGVLLTTPTSLRQYTSSGLKQVVNRPEEFKNKLAGSYNLSEIWQADPETGLSSAKTDGSQWTITRDNMFPNAPGPFYSSAMAVHPDKGLLVGAYGYDTKFSSNFNHDNLQLFSGYKSGEWTNYSPFLTNPEQTLVMKSPHSIAVDPDNPKYVYLTSQHNGIVRINVNDPTDILHLSDTGDKGKDLEGFVALVPEQAELGWGSCYFSFPRFDFYGNMWFTFADYEHQVPEKKIVTYYWSAADRKNSVNADNVVLPVRVEFPGRASTVMEEILPLKTSGKRNLLVYKSGRYADYIIIMDTKGTPTDTSDDQIVIMENFYDQDGNSFEVNDINTLYEDTSTGYVWVGHTRGVFYFNPSDIMAGATNVYRVKVARNDGTNLADYLLNEVKVNSIISDGSGRKWFATGGGGLVCTSYDGREVITEINSGNSEIPSDNVYTAAYFPANNSLMLSTEEGLAEYFISGNAPQKEDKQDVKCYPNPVRPDYLGFVTIEGLPAGSLVKIADSAGHVVKELGVIGGTEAQWDITNTQFKRVNSGVYFILASPGADSDGSAGVGKVLVVN